SRRGRRTRERSGAFLRAAGRYVRTHPVSFAFVVIILTSAALTESLWGEDASIWGAGPLATFAAGRWWTLLTALVIPDSTIDAVVSAVLAVTMLAYAERLLGSRRTAVLVAVLGLAGLLTG
ncbi:hypothetical protein, partial [Escherichia coli]|uniref:hypothetical protein n=1 Tax=Escherichia coli TaxID=562 RepID=UPI00278C2D65